MKAVASECTDVTAGRGVQGSDADVNGAPSETRQARRLVRGRGSVMAAIGDSWKATLIETEFVSPDAPFAHGSGGRQWFTVDHQVLRPDCIQAARRAFDGLVSEIIEREGSRMICRTSRLAVFRRVQSWHSTPSPRDVEKSARS